MLRKTEKVYLYDAWKNESTTNESDDETIWN